MKALVVRLLLTILFLSLELASASTIEGTIYSANLEPEQNVLVEINSTPVQRFLARDGTYSFNVPFGNYALTAQKEAIMVHENFAVTHEGTFLYDLFLLPDTSGDEDLWNDTQEPLFEPDPWYVRWQYWVGIALLIAALGRYIFARRKYGPITLFRKRIQEETLKTVEQHQEELAREPGYLDNALKIIQKHDGRITQKELRKEMLYLSEAKISLIITELEHKGKVEKVKKGRGNVILLKQ